MIFCGTSTRLSTPPRRNESNDSVVALCFDRLAMGWIAVVPRVARAGIPAAGHRPQCPALCVSSRGDGGRRHVHRTRSAATAPHRLCARPAGLHRTALLRLLPAVRRAARALPAVHLPAHLLRG